ncbi:MAG TPA: hypothetical protein VIJ51_06590 [Solirubrobacteraceae bacterium]
MRRRIRAAAGSAGPTPTQSGPKSPVRGRQTSRSVSTVSPSRPNLPTQPESAGRPGDTFEWDMRKSDGPTDSAFYDCGCGYKFTARVATTVRCPNCGSGQAW